MSSYKDCEVTCVIRRTTNNIDRWRYEILRVKHPELGDINIEWPIDYTFTKAGAYREIKQKVKFEIKRQLYNSKGPIIFKLR